MGNVCACVCKQTDEDEAADALLDGFDSQLSRPRGPPPPYQVNFSARTVLAKVPKKL